MPPVSRLLIEKIEALPAERLAELEDFVETLHQHGRNDALPQPTEAASASGFAEAPTNPEDNLGKPRIKCDPHVMMGKPVITGTRITVEHILRLLGAGDTAADILHDHPQLTEADLHAAQGYAADRLAHESVAPTE